LNEEKGNVEKIQQALTDTEKLIKEYPNPDKNLEEIKERIANLKSKSVSERELPRIIQQLTKKTSELSIEIVSIKPIKELSFKEERLPEGISKSYIEVVLKAPYKVIGSYFKALVDLPTVYTVESISVEKFENTEEDASKKKKEEEGKVIANLLLSSYTMSRI